MLPWVRDPDVVVSLLSSIAEGVVIVDSSGSPVRWNAAAEALLDLGQLRGGSPDADPAGAAWLHRDGVGGPDGAPLPREGRPLGRALRGENVDDAELLVTRPGAAPALLSASARPFRDAEGRIVGAMAIFRDVTPARRERDTLRAASEAVARAEEMFRLTFEDAPIGMAIVGLDGRWLRVNGALCAIVGYTRAELQALSLQDVTHPDDLAADLSPVERLVRGDIPRCELAKRYVRKDGALVEVLLGVSLVRGKGGAPRHFIAQIQDVTDKRLLQQQLMLQDRLASVGTLAAGVAHEMNNPLAHVLLSAEQLSDGLRELAGGSPSSRLRELVELVGEIRDGSERLRRIVRGLRAFTRADEELPAALDLRAVLDAAANLAMNEIGQRARLCKAYEEVPLVEADEVRLTQVFTNLLVNAAQAIPEGRAAEHVVGVRTYLDAAGWVVGEVSDTGEGMAEPVRRRIFDPFFTTKPVGKGTGLGLSISHGIVQRLGGEIAVDSAPGRGSVFRVRLPPSPARETGPRPSAAPAPRSMPPPAAAPDARRARVLLVDDDALVLRSLTRLLAADHEVDAVQSGAAALERLTAPGAAYDAIVSDLMMPEMTGMELHARVAAARPELAERMVFLTGGAFTPEARAFQGRVSSAFLDKPVDARALKKLLAGIAKGATG